MGKSEIKARWHSKQSPTASAQSGLTQLRSKSHTSAKCDVWYSRALSLGVTGEIGSGITPSPATNDKEFNATARELYRDFAQQPDYTGTLANIYAIQSAIVRCRKESGGALVRIIRHKPSRTLKMAVPLSFQVLEMEYLPESYSIRINDDVEIKNGIEVNSEGKILAFHLFKSHPDDFSNSVKSNPNIANLQRIKACDIIYHFIPARAGALFARPENANALAKSEAYGDYNDAELERKKVRSAHTGVFTREGFEGEDDAEDFDAVSGTAVNNDDELSVPILEIEAGTFVDLPEGRKLQLFDGDDNGAGLKDYLRSQLLSISTACSVPYELLSGDFSGINDRIWRAIMTQYSREIEEVQNLYIIPQVCAVMWREFIDRAIITGKIQVPSDFDNPMTKYRCTFHAQPFAPVNPLQDTKTDILKMQHNITPRSKIVEKANPALTVEESDQQIKDDLDRSIDLGIFKEPEESEDAELNNSN